MKVVESKPEDIDELAECYAAAFPESVSAALGKKYLKKVLEWFLSTHQNFLFHLSDESTNEIIGFCGGLINDGIHARGSASEMIQYSFREGIQALALRPWVVFHKEMRGKYGLAFRNLIKRLRSIAKKKKVITTYKPGTIEPFVGLVVIGIKPSFQNKGYARILLEEFERVAKNTGIKMLKLSVKADNLQAIKSYQKAGWTIKENKGSSISLTKFL